MSLATIVFLLTQQSELKNDNIVEIEDAGTLQNSEGEIKGQDEDGNKIVGFWHGKSLAARVADGELARDEEGNWIEVKPEPKKRRRRRRRRKRGNDGD